MSRSAIHIYSLVRPNISFLKYYLLPLLRTAMDSQIHASGHTTPDKKRSDSTSFVPQKIEQADHPATPRTVDAETEKRLLRKLDMRIIPMICWIYLMNFMDRGMIMG